MLQHVLLCTIVALSIILMLVRPRGVAEVYWIAGGAMLLVALRLIPVRLAGRAIAEGSDVYLFLIGMMLLSELARAHGVFDWVSSLALRHAEGSALRLFTLVYAIGTVVTVFMSNDATAVVLTPAILAVVRKAKAAPRPHLFACAMIANAASFVLPVSNPANLVVFHQGMPSLRGWLGAFLVPSLASIGATYVVLRVIFRKELRGTIETTSDRERLGGDGRLVLIGLVLMVGVLLAVSSLNKDLGLPTCLAAMAITIVVSIRSRSNPIDLLRAISWSTLLLVAGLFVLVAAVESIGALAYTTAALRYAQRLPPAMGAWLAGSIVALGNNLVNNLPMGLIAGATLSAAHSHGLIASSVLIGVDLDPNLSITGSLATILWMLALRAKPTDDSIKVTFLTFLRVGAIAMPVAFVCSIIAAVLISLSIHV